MLLSFIPNVGALVEQTDEFYINDYANILSEETENYILTKSIELNKTNGSQIVVVTVENLDGMTIEDYSLQLFRKFGIGDKDKNNGLLFLIALEEREFRIEVGYGLEGILPDGKVGRLEDKYIIPYFKNDRFDEGIKSGYDVFYSEIINNSLTNEESNTINNKILNIVNNINPYILFIFINIFTGIVFGVIRRCIKKKNKDSYNNSSMFKCNMVYIVVLLLLLIIQSILNFGRISILLLGINILICATVYAPHTKLPGGYSTSSSRTHGSYSRSSSSGRHRGGGGSSGGGGASRRF